MTSLFKSWLVWCLLFLIWLACSWAVFRPGFFRVHDYVHAARISEMTLALEQGQFPVRWVPNFGFGYGMPLFEFYAPLPYYAGAMVYWATGQLLWSVKSIFLLANLGTVVGAYLLGRQWGGRTAGLVTAASLTLAPYRAVNLFVRGAVSEAWGIMALPWIVVGITRCVRGTQQHGWRSSQTWSGLFIVWLGLVVLLLSHNLTAMMFVPMSVVFGALYLTTILLQQSKNAHKKIIEVSTLLAGAYSLAVGVTAFYWLPALMEKKFVKIDSILGGYFHYSQHFLYLRQFWTSGWGFGGSQWGPEDGISFFLGYGQWLGLLTLGVVLGRVVWWHSKHGQWRQLVFKTSVVTSLITGMLLVLSLWLSTLKSQWLWDAVPALAFIQFPWRWLSLVILWIAILNGLAVTLLHRTLKRYLVGGFLLVVLLLNAWYFQPESQLDDASTLYYSDPARIQSEMSHILPDYIPVGLSEEPVPPPAAAWSHREGEGLDPKMEILVDRGHQILLRTNYEVETLVQVAVAPFPGWRVELDGQPTKGLERLGLYGNLALEIPPGNHLVGVMLGSTPIRSWADTISVVSGLMIAGLALEVAQRHHD